ncbi:MAG: hypothetical protein JNJ57_17480, partial [Saprospiraceae bacterium]|nr:hypothetical protein [Saprospiraceae bacterium]
MTHKSYSGINALSVNLLKCLVFTLFLVGWAPAHAQIDLIDPDNFTEQHSYDPCFVETPFEYLPESVNSTLCDEFPNYEPSENCTIAAGTVTVYGQNEVVQNKNFLVNGNWTIRPGSSLIFQNCNFKIAPGAQITVKCFNTQTMTFEGCKFFSCDIMWRGISVEHAFSVLELTPPSFNFINCEIEDAASALWLRNPSLAVLYKIQGSIFNNNYIGLSVFHDWANGIPTWAPLVFWGNTMTTSQNLRPYFSIKTPPGYPKAYAGISAKKVSSYLGTPASRNTFTRMRNGMVCEKSVITVNHNDFIGLWENGIQSNASSLTVLNDNRFDGPTNMPGITPPIMENGIWATGSDLYISDTKFNRRIRNGINSEGNYHAEQIEIHD